MTQLKADTVRIVSTQRVADTLVVRDSILVREQRRGDTVFVEKRIVRFRDRDIHHTHLDTLYTSRNADTNRSVSRSSRTPWWLWLLLALALAFLARTLARIRRP